MASAGRGTLLGALFAAAVVLALLLRVRSLVGRTPRVALLLLGMASAGLGLLAAALLGDGMVDLAVVLVGLLVVAGVVATAVVLPRRRATPMSGRGLDLLEGLVLVSILPLVAGAMELYSWARHL